MACLDKHGVIVNRGPVPVEDYMRVRDNLETVIARLKNGIKESYDWNELGICPVCDWYTPEHTRDCPMKEENLNEDG